MMTNYTSIGITCIILSCLLFFLVTSWGNVKSNTLQTLEGGGVILTFDDDFIPDWYEANKRLSKYGWKATFFVSKFHLLQTEDVKRLKVLQTVGHEIASHGINHINALEFISENTVDEYLGSEILPSLHAMQDMGFEINSFAYPAGARIPYRFTDKVEYLLLGDKKNILDELLLNHFKIIRTTTYGKEGPPNFSNIANGSRLVSGLGIDKSYGNDIDYIISMLQYAKENNKVVIFYGHRILNDDSNSKHVTNYETLEKICKYVVNSDMQFMTMDDLVID